MRTTLEVVSPFSLDINVTHAMIDTIVSTAKLWSQGLQNVRSKQEVQQASRFYPLTVRNLTGVDMRLTRALEVGCPCNTRVHDPSLKLSFLTLLTLPPTPLRVERNTRLCKTEPPGDILCPSKKTRKKSAVLCLQCFPVLCMLSASSMSD